MPDRHIGRKSVTICVEAKADEPFGEETVGSYWKKKKESTSKIPDRISAFLEIIFDVKTDPKNCPPSIYSKIPYQLLTGYVGTLIQAVNDGSDIAIFVIHEFHTHKTDSEKIALNEMALNNFFNLIPGLKKGRMIPGIIYGPIQCRKSRYIRKDINLYLGRAVFDWHQ